MQDFKLNKLYIFRKYMNSPAIWNNATYDLMQELSANSVCLLIKQFFLILRIIRTFI